MGTTSETFFRPDEVSRETNAIPASLFNRCRLLLARSGRDHVFLPVRSMQYQAVIDHEEVIFVDNHAYAVRDGVGGRLIVLAWVFVRARSRDSLNQPVPIELVGYQSSAASVHKRLMYEFPRALEIVERRVLDTDRGKCSKRVITFPVQDD